MVRHGDGKPLGSTPPTDPQLLIKFFVFRGRGCCGLVDFRGQILRPRLPMADWGRHLYLSRGRHIDHGGLWRRRDGIGLGQGACGRTDGCNHGTRNYKKTHGLAPSKLVVDSTLTLVRGFLFQPFLSTRNWRETNQYAAVKGCGLDAHGALGDARVLCFSFFLMLHLQELRNHSEES